jgi:hypothetical protein
MMALYRYLINLYGVPTSPGGEGRGAPTSGEICPCTRGIRCLGSSDYLFKLIVAEIKEKEIGQGEVGQVSNVLQPVVVEH